MPASEETFYNLKRLHVVFAIASLALLAVTAWMVGADHWRQWKVYQRVFRDQVEPWLTEARIQQERTADFAARDHELSDALVKAQAVAPGRGLIDRFVQTVREDANRRGAPAPDCAPLETACEALVAELSAASRHALLARLRAFLDAARLRQENLERQLRFRRAEFDEARSNFEAAVGEGRSQAQLDLLQERATRIQQAVDRLGAQAEEASTHSNRLAQILGEITRDEDAARARLANHRATADRLGRTLVEQRPSLVKRLLRLPLIDAFGRPLAIDQVWLPELTIDYNFRQVARFDRCMTCHQGIDKTTPGTASEPACRSQMPTTVQLATPAAPPEGQGGGAESLLEKLYGLVLAPRGILDADAPTVQLVQPRSAAAQADLQVGDVIVKIDGRAIAGREQAVQELASPARWGQALRLEIRRGLPHPYSSHPRLDLFVGSRSPHPAATFGCTVCHEGQGSATEFCFASHTPNVPADRARWRNEHGWFWNPDWDFPMRPKRFLQSSCLKCHHEVSDLEPSARFRDPPAAKLLDGHHLVRQYGCFGCHEIKGVADSPARTGPDMRLEPNGTMRKVGPSLLSVAGRLHAAFVQSWLRRPSDFRPSTRMPQLFGLHEHLSGKTLDDARRFEAAEIEAVAEFLLAVSQPVEALPVPKGVTEQPSADRGKQLFQIHGCLACHRHADFPEGQSTVGPELSRLGAKLTSESGRKWLADWIRDPARHNACTLMPNAMLEPIPLSSQEAAAKPAPSKSAAPRRTDPAADIAAYLVSSAGWLPEKQAEAARSDLDELALLSLSKTFSKRLAEQYLREGIPEPMAGQVQGDARELLGKITRQKKLRYVGRQTIRKRGCFGCHDVPGFQDAAPIGPALSDWGRKQTSLLAFERVNQFVAQQQAAGSGQQAADKTQPAARVAAELAPRDAQQGGDAPAAARDFFREALASHRREGFLWQKLHAPRSFDYKKADNKGFNEQLLMGRFSLSDEQIEAVMTFVLGLVSAPPAEKYVYRPERRSRAIVEGRKVLDKYACAQCHTLEMERWTFRFDPARFVPPNPAPDYPFLKPPVSNEQLAASRALDRRGLAAAEVVGMPRVDAQGKLSEEEDDDGQPLYFFDLWEPAVIQGAVWPVGGAQVPIARSQLTRLRAPVGGELARLLYPAALAAAKASGSTAAEVEAWGWVPPPLAYEGRAVEPTWLYDYLLSPPVLRPAAVLRMPKYNLSAEEAGRLVDFFAAAAGADSPYTQSGWHWRPAIAGRKTGNTALPRADARRPDTTRLDAAMRILTDRKTFCAKCHLIGDFSPGGQIQTTLAPNLENAGRRLRPEHLRRWLANPKSVLPYTAMPVNFPPAGEPLGQDLYRASSAEQLDAMVDLLLNYDWYMNRRTSIQKMIESVQQETPAAKKK